MRNRKNMDAISPDALCLDLFQVAHVWLHVCVAMSLSPCVDISLICL